MTHTPERQQTDRDALLDQLAVERGIVLERDVPIGPMTTLRVGGTADRLTTVRTTESLVAALRLARDSGLPAGVLGKGSDIVVSDRGIRGLVIRNRADAIAIEGTTVRAESGAAMAAVTKRCAAEGLGGFEFGISIPGTVGGAVWANAGAHGGEMKDVLVSVDAWTGERDGGDQVTISAEECGFGYRTSVFKHGAWTVLEALIHLVPDEPAQIASRVNANRAHRRSTQPLADQNAGSVFRNPPGDHAGRLIEAAGLKGRRIGSAQVSMLHANFIVVDRGGSADHVRRLGDHVRAAVAERFGVELEYEIEFVGDWSGGGPWSGPDSELVGAR